MCAAMLLSMALAEPFLVYDKLLDAFLVEQVLPAMVTEPLDEPLMAKPFLAELLAAALAMCFLTTVFLTDTTLPEMVLSEECPDSEYTFSEICKHQ